MKYKVHPNNINVCLETNDLLMESLIKVVNAEEIKSGWITGIGDVKAVELGYFDIN